jgi:hypothetical protein
LSNSVERPKLGAAFSGGVPDRSSGLSELLAARPRQGSSPAEPTKAPIETEVAPPAQTIKKDPSTRGAKAPAPEGDKVSNVVAYLEGEVYAAVRVARRAGVPPSEPDKSYDQLLVEALAIVTVEELLEHFRPVVPDAGDSLLVARQRRPRGSGAAQLNFRLTESQKANLVELGKRVGAPSRSALVDAALRLALVKAK